MTVQPGIYRHYKGGMYIVLGVAIDSDDAQARDHGYVQQVVYWDIKQQTLWRRDVELFLAPVHIGGNTVVRYQLLHAAPLVDPVQVEQFCATMLSESTSQEVSLDDYTDNPKEDGSDPGET
jgi:hypothetical protein